MHNSPIRSLVYVALFAALFIVLGMVQMRLGFSAVPITLQTLGIILAGLFLRPVHAFASIALVILLTAFGLPLFGGDGGISKLTGPSAGFIFAFPFCAMLTSILVGKLISSKRMISNKVITTLLLFAIFLLISSLLSYIPGLLWMKNVVLSYSWNKVLTIGGSFVPGDTAKAFVGALIAVSLLPVVYRFRSTTDTKKMNQFSTSD
ncbi:biotin transporter BioY [Paenibacillus sp. GSMTC-2017]|uniref:biotin transporter BioY n=1 Tax=Paenibacillus sp. GSMTC-2017 TaxID=2794350 RepID=UPI0018D67746|nr:biotin transporter BioY [Paenibacillus sp. GSMTC-2017]MBH5316551.1 biotin transporter BioY [Paenibacillus sp. GSMTC-2017]